MGRDPDPGLLEAGREALGGGDFHGAHERWEEAWRALADGPDREVLKGLVQAAVALHHRAAGNAAGAAQVGARARGRLGLAPAVWCGLDVDAFRRGLAAALDGGADVPAPHLGRTLSGTSWGPVDVLREALRPEGLDLVVPFPVDAYNAAVEPPYRLEGFGRERALAVLVGNSAALWPRFLEAVRHDLALAEGPDPLDAYVAVRVREAAACVHARHDVRFAHTPPPRRVAMQRAAQVAGLAWLGPAHLSVHPLHGPWLALRAVVVYDLDAPAADPPAPPDPCTACAQPCLAALDAALAAHRGAALAPGKLGPSWHRWLAVRDACPVGRPSRYPEAQIRYHYALDRRALHDAAM